jgi:HAD superfamily hydrolase (TIGR01459 family)
VSVSVIQGLRDVAGNYDGFVLDLWGVVHDGVTVFPGVVDALQQLHAAGKKLVFLSNAPRRAHMVAAQLDGFGITASLHDGVMSSGEAAWRYLHDRPDDWAQNLGPQCLLIGPERDNAALDGLGFNEAEGVESADFVLVTGPKDQMNSAEPYEDMLRTAFERRLPMICANPDREVIMGGVRQICAGAIAERYEDMGGDVRWYGKPDPTIYDECFRLLQINDRTRILGIGDSFTTDIRGANAAGLDALLVARGIHGEELIDADGKLDGALIAARTKSDDVQLIGAVSEFVW